MKKRKRRKKRRKKKMIGNSELIIIAIVALLLFGPDKLPELARSIGKASGEFKRASREAERELTEEFKETKENLNLKEIETKFVEELKGKKE